MEVSGQLHAPYRFNSQGKSLYYPLDGRLGGPQSRSGPGSKMGNPHPYRESIPTRSLVTVLNGMLNHSQQNVANYQTNSMEQSPSWEANSHSASQEITRLSWTWRFRIVFTRSRHWSLSWARWIQATPSQPTSLISILILSSNLCVSLQNGLFPSCFPTKNLEEYFIAPMRATCPAHIANTLSLQVNVTIENYKIRGYKRQIEGITGGPTYNI
jgi:hypothetical protein